MEDKIIIDILGDICPGRGFFEQFDSGNPEKVFHNILPVLKSADLVVGNLESPATYNEEKLLKNSINIKAKPKNVPLLKEAGICGLSLANNHILDYGVEGLKDTIDLLENNDIFYYGIEKNNKRNNSFYIYETKGYKIGLLSFAEQEFNCSIDYGLGAILWDDLDSVDIIRNVKKQCDYLIVQYHGGIEHYIYPSPNLQKRCRAMANAGADFVTCQHSHCIGTYEEWRDSTILYGQGNTLFGFRDKEKWDTGLIVEIVLGESRKIKFIPIVAKNDGEYLAESKKSEIILSSFYENSKNVIDNKFILNNWKDFCNTKSYMYLPMQFAWGRILNKINQISKGKMIKLFTKSKSRMTAMNLIRCDAHREVVKTIFENEFYKT